MTEEFLAGTVRLRDDLSFWGLAFFLFFAFFLFLSFRISDGTSRVIRELKEGFGGSPNGPSRLSLGIAIQTPRLIIPVPGVYREMARPWSPLRRR
jgi:hypothetical protein